MHSLKVLFSPSELKVIETSRDLHLPTLREHLLKHSHTHLEEFLQKYETFLQNASEGQIQKLFGTKKISPQELSLCQNILDAPTLPAIQRYSGVAFKALDFSSLNEIAQEFINTQVFIFSNLLGVIRADTPIPYYKLKQGEGFFDFETQKFYQSLQKQLVSLCKNSILLDLRAGFYQKCFIPKDNFTIEPIFKKGTKTLSHYSKHYRGLLLRTLAQNSSTLSNSSNLNSFFSTLYIEGLELENITQEKNTQKTLLHYQILASN